VINMKSIRILGKSIPLFVMVLLLVGLGSATLLTYYGRITGMVTVSQGLLVDGKSYDVPIQYSHATTSIEDPTFVSVHYLENNANVDAEVGIVSTCSGAGSCPNINIKHYKTNLKSGSLVLSKKNSDWDPIEGKITVTYKTDVETGKFVVDSISTLPSGYILVYYADEKFANDGTRLATPGKAYKLIVGENSAIPFSSDGNIKGAVDYCNNVIDDYAHCKGAKIWAVPESDYNSDTNTLKWSSGWQSDYYFETDLLGWTNTELTNPTVSAGTKLDFVIVSDFPMGMMTGTYTITTSVVPVAQ